MNSSAAGIEFAVPPQQASSRLDYLDATRAFALVLGILFHASLSFTPSFIGWAVQDISTSPLVLRFIAVSHSFRMETFFLLAGFFGRATFHRKGALEFVRTRVLRIVVPFVVGWFLLRPLLVSGWIMGGASLRGDYDFWAGIKGGFESLKTLPAGIFTGTHLWFLYYLAMITALALTLRGLVTRTGSLQDIIIRIADRFVAWLAHSWACLPVLVIPTSAMLWFMHFWGMDTPDQTLQPNIPVILVYAAFFILGWLLSRQHALIPRFAHLSPSRWGLAGLGMAGTLLLNGFAFEASHPHYTAAHVAFVASYALMMWSLVFLILGLFKQFCEQERLWVRYVADSSYWLYLLHLPIVVWLQVAMAEVSLHWSVKLAFIFTSTVAVSLLSYDFFVRSTWIGWILNGRRRDRVIAPLVAGKIRHLWRREQLGPIGKSGPQ